MNALFQGSHLGRLHTDVNYAINAQNILELPSYVSPRKQESLWYHSIMITHQICLQANF